MRGGLDGDGGSLAVLTVILLPIVLVVFLGLLELGVVRVVVERARIAADLATVTAVNDQDAAELARTGRLRPAADAERVAREHFALNIAPLAGSLAVTPEAIAAASEVAVLPRGDAIDPRTGRAYAGPAVRLAADLPVRTPIFAALLGRPVVVARILSVSAAR